MPKKPPRHEDYGLVDIEEDAIFELLPHVVRGVDPGGIKTYLGAMASEHNFFIEKLRQMPRLQDPTKAGKFNPGKLGEDPDKYDEWIELKKRNDLTDGEKLYLAQLETQIPQTLAANTFEQNVLGLLSRTVGARSYGQYQIASIRELITTAVTRHHIKGTHSSVYVLGRILGFIDLKVTELWSRFSIKDPSDPKAIKNIGDFATSPDHYPYWPLELRYDGETTRLLDRENGLETGTFRDESFQLPLPHPDYDPNLLDDFGFRYTVTFPKVEDSLLSTFHYNQVVDKHNPFGDFEEVVEHRLKPGVYQMEGGSENRRAKAAIPNTDEDRVYNMAAIALGDWANDVTVSIFTNRDGSQRITISGPQSKIKFKSSYFDLSLAVDAIIYPTLFPAVPIKENPGNSYLDPDYNPTVVNVTDFGVSKFGTTFPEVEIDGELPTVETRVRLAGVSPTVNGDWIVLQHLDESTMLLKEGPAPYNYDWTGGGTLTYGRQAGDFPWTSDGSANRIIADPDTHWQQNMETYSELVASLRDMFETIRPMTRTIRREAFGFLFRDVFLYAPLITIPEVILQAPNGTLYDLRVDANGTVSWVEVGSGSPTSVVQKDRNDTLLYTWTITNDGKFLPVRYANPTDLTQEHVVFVRQDNFSGYVFVDEGVLKASASSPEQVVDTIHTDGTPDEAVLLLEYQNYVENAPDEIKDFMSPDAVSTDKPSDEFTFQTSPEDSLTTVRHHNDILFTHIGIGWGDNVETPEGFPSMVEGGWLYDFSGNFISTDNRARHPGIDAGIIEPVPTGVESDLDAQPNGLSYDYPVEFMNYHGIAAWRDRVDNDPFWSCYTFAMENDNPLVGGTRIDTSLLAHDGPIEMGVVAQTSSPQAIGEMGLGVTPNDKVFDADNQLDRLWRKYEERPMTPVKNFDAVRDEGGNAVLEFSSLADYTAGQHVRIDGSSNYDGVYRVVRFEEDSGSPGTFLLELPTAFVATDTGTCWAKAQEIQLWQDEDITYTLAPLVTQQEDLQEINYRVVKYGTVGLGASYEETHTLLASGTLGFEGVELAVSALKGETVAVEISGLSPVLVRLTHEADNGTMSEDDWDGDLMSYGGHRDALVITLIEDGENWDDIGEAGGDVSSYEPVGGKRWWRGGGWSV